MIARPARRSGAVAGAVMWLAFSLSVVLARGAEPPSGQSFTFELASARGPLKVHAYAPANPAPGQPIWVVMHGQRRDAQDYFRTWLPHATSHRAILVVPEFDQEGWPKSTHYQLGNVMSSHVPVPRAQWSFTAVDLAIDEALRRAGREPASARIDLYGHGAGAQFVQRYVLHTGARRVRLAIAANAGWYLLPDDTFDFPYGLRDLPMTQGGLRDAFAVPLVILLGQSDLRNDGVLRRNGEADAQGSDRLHRGRFFIARARAAASRLGAVLKWRVQEVAGAGHSDEGMLPAALSLLEGPAPKRD